jgi:8-oxo-dGTP pyrophosphatase MutT (NUDIX family)
MIKLKQLHVARLVNQNDFWAGVIIQKKNHLLLTLNEDHLPSSRKHSAYRVGGVGGGKKADETLWHCAKREAYEETGSQVTLISSNKTYFHDIDQGIIIPCTVIDSIAPYYLGCVSDPKSNPMYYGVFLADVTNDVSLVPSDDVIALIWYPLAYLSWLEQGITVKELISRGVKVIGREELDLHKICWLPPDENMRLIFNWLTEERV